MTLFPIAGALLNPDHISLVRFGQADGTPHADVSLLCGETVRLTGPDLDRLRVLVNVADAEPQSLDARAGSTPRPLLIPDADELIDLGDDDPLTGVSTERQA